MTEAPLVAGLATLASRYDAFLLDQFGVLHDGSTVYPGVVACLEALQAAGKRTIILSNSGTLRAASMERLARLGIPRSEEHTSELQSLMRTSYAVFCLKKKKITNHAN